MLCVLRLGCNCFECVGKSALAVCSLAGRFCASYSLAGCFVSRMFIGWTFLCCLHERQSYAIKTVYWTVPHHPAPTSSLPQGLGTRSESWLRVRIQGWTVFLVFLFMLFGQEKLVNILTCWPQQCTSSQKQKYLCYKSVTIVFNVAELPTTQ